MRVTRYLSLVLLVLGICAGISIPQASARQRWTAGSGTPMPAIDPADERRIDRLERWLTLAAEHTPGVDDEPLAEIAAWPNVNLKTLWADANILVQLMRTPRAEPNAITLLSTGKSSTQMHYTSLQARRLHVLACVAGGRLPEPECVAMRARDNVDPDLRQLAVLARASLLEGDSNYILRRGALLHGDVAILAPQAMDAPGAVQPPVGGGLERFRMNISDGRQLDLRLSAVHWEIARMLLDFVTLRGSDRPDPGGDDMVRGWYRATAAWMQLTENHDKLHLERARAIFPSDPDILFLSACQRETYAGPPIQAAVRSALLPTGVTIDVGSEHAELRQAETLFRRVLEIKPEFAEARLRFGRVLGLLGRHADAAVELRRAASELPETDQVYYAALFLGAEEEALGNREPARAAYERAVALAPRAQSPLLALSQLARRYGDRPEALRAIERLFSLPDEDRHEHDDPFWWYYVAQARNADDLLEALRQPYLPERLQ